MPDESFKRKLTAILSADVEGYSRLMSQDEVGTTVLQQYLDESGTGDGDYLVKSRNVF